MPWAHFPLTRESQFAVVTQFQSDYWAGREFVFGAFDAQGSLVGCAGLHPRTALNPLALELGYWCHSARAGQGWTTLSAQILIALAFDHLGSDRVQVMHDEANTASQRVIEKCGFTFEGVQRNVTGAVSAALVADGYRGTGRHRTYALTPEDLPSLGWLPALRAALTIKDALGGVFPGRPLGT
jgi:RimJ/RimL family protein N-acetyltransferase